MKRMTRKSSFVKPMLEALEDRITPSGTYTWHPVGQTTDVDETAMVNGQQVYINWDAGTYGYPSHPLVSDGLPKAGDSVFFNGNANKTCTVDTSIEGNVHLVSGYNAQINILANDVLTMDSYTDDSVVGTSLNVNCGSASTVTNLAINGTNNAFHGFNFTGTGAVTIDGGSDTWGEFSGLTCEDDCSTTLAAGTLAIGPQTVMGGWSTVTMKAQLMIGSGTNTATLVFNADNGGARGAPLITAAIGDIYITTDGNDPNTLINFANPNNIANPFTNIRMAIAQEGGLSTINTAGAWVEQTGNGGWSYKLDAGTMKLTNSSTLECAAGFRVSGFSNTDMGTLQIADSTTCAIATGLVNNGTKYYLDVGSDGQISFTSPTGFGRLAYQNIEVTSGGTLNMRIAGGTNGMCDELIPMGTFFGLGTNDAAFAGGTIDVTANNPVVIGSGTTWTLVGPDPNASISSNFQTDFLPTGTFNDTTKLPGSWVLATDQM